MNQIRIYSPGQVACGVFLGGPAAFVYFLAANFRALGKTREAKNALLFGLLLNIALLALLPFLPEWFPNFAIPLAMAIVATQIAASSHLTKEAIADSGIFARHSNWRVVGMSIAWAVLFIVVFVALVVGLEEFGIVLID